MDIRLTSPFKKLDGALVHHAYRGADMVGTVTEVFRDVFYITVHGKGGGHKGTRYRSRKAAVEALDAETK